MAESRSRGRKLVPILAGLVAGLMMAACGGREPVREAPVDATAHGMAPAAGEASSSATAVPAMAALQPGTLDVVVEPVRVLHASEDALADVRPGESVDIAEGSGALIGDKGVAFLTWPEFLRAELLSGTVLTATRVVPDQRAVTVHQDAGTVRYSLLDPAAPADVTVVAGEMVLRLGGSPADVIVSHGPEGYGAVWAVLVSGQVGVRASPRDDMGVADDAAVVDLSAGHVIALVGGAALSQPLPVDVVGVELWYGDVASGRLKRTIAEVAFRCEVTADEVALLASIDDTLARIGRLRRGAIVEALARNRSGDWVKVATLSPSAHGWVPAAALACTGPTAALLLADDEFDPASSGALALLTDATGQGALPPSALVTPTTPAAGAPPTMPVRTEPTDDPSEPECVDGTCEVFTPTPGPPTRTRRPTSPPTKTPEGMPTLPPTATPKSKRTPVPTSLPEPTGTPDGPTATPAPTATVQPLPTPVQSMTPTAISTVPRTATATRTVTPTATGTSTPTGTSTGTSTPEPTAARTHRLSALLLSLAYGT